MAFSARVEFWKVSTGGDGLPAIVLDAPIADAVDVVATMEDPINVPDNGYTSYAMSVFGLEGLCFVTKGKDPGTSAARGRLIPANTGHWFIVKKGEKYFVGEYT